MLDDMEECKHVAFIIFLELQKLISSERRDIV